VKGTVLNTREDRSSLLLLHTQDSFGVCVCVCACVCVCVYLRWKWEGVGDAKDKQEKAKRLHRRDASITAFSVFLHIGNNR
jgi:hypothetical protein